jgi:hypothetical protein
VCIKIFFRPSDPIFLAYVTGNIDLFWTLWAEIKATATPRFGSFRSVSVNFIYFNLVSHRGAQLSMTVLPSLYSGKTGSLLDPGSRDGKFPEIFTGGKFPETFITTGVQSRPRRQQLFSLIVTRVARTRTRSRRRPGNSSNSNNSYTLLDRTLGFGSWWRHLLLLPRV